MNSIVTEEFNLTPAIKAHIDMNLSHLRALLPPEASVRIFLSEPSQDRFTVLVKVRTEGKNLNVRESGCNLYRAVNMARNQLQHRIIAQYDHGSNQRKSA